MEMSSGIALTLWLLVSIIEIFLQLDPYTACCSNYLCLFSMFLINMFAFSAQLFELLG